MHGISKMQRRSPDFPEELDLAFYRRTNPDLRGMSDTEARAHFARHGIAEGRQGSPLALREALIEIVRASPSVLEIGPFFNPLVRGRGVAYFDVLDTAALQRRATQVGQDPRGVPEIDYVSPSGDLSVVPDRFRAVVSSHCIEHQPDLVRHLQQVGDLLEPGGHYFLVVPNRLYCFDHFLADSTLAGIIAAHIEGRRVHRLESVIEHRALTTHNAVKRHWVGDHLDRDYHATVVPRAKAAVAEHAAAAGGYVDVHAWQFTPGSFRAILTALADGGYSPLRPLRVYETPRDRSEFTAILVKEG
jgi:SAM-dependent methyltransferase